MLLVSFYEEVKQVVWDVE